MISHINRSSPARIIGVESFHGFGDCCFNIPLIKALSNQSHCKIGVATKSQCADAFHNLPWIDEIINIRSMNDGDKVFKQLGYHTTYQITQNAWFQTFKASNHEHSLIDTPTEIAIKLNLPSFDPRPIYILSEQELQISQPKRPVIAIETVYHSLQSWATADDFALISAKYQDTHDIIWLSNPEIPRRRLIPYLQYAEIFFSVGSGFFCSMLALPANLQPRKTICLWIDDLYKYKKRLAELNWADIIWVHNRNELTTILK